MPSESTRRAPMTMSNLPLVRETEITFLQHLFWKFPSSDLAKETVEVVESGSCPLDQLPGKVPDDVGRFKHLK